MRTMPRLPRRLPRGIVPRAVVAVLVTLAAGVVAWLVAAAAASPDRVSATGKDYGLPAARVDIAIQPDGSVEVVERITFDFDGSFQGAFRDIPMRRVTRSIASSCARRPVPSPAAR